MLMLKGNWLKKELEMGYMSELDVLVEDVIGENNKFLQVYKDIAGMYIEDKVHSRLTIFKLLEAIDDYQATPEPLSREEF